MSSNKTPKKVMNFLKRILPDTLAVIFFAILAFAYFFPADVEDRILYQHDTSAGVGAGQEASVYAQDHPGKRTRWTNALFSGMPTYQIAPAYDSANAVSVIEKAYHLWWLPDNVWFVFAYLLGFYILLRAFDFRQYLAALGAVMWAFSTYFLIIIAAGHLWKVMALAYLPPMIGGIVLAYRGKYLWGLVVTALFSTLEVHANHFQMTYYYLLIILCMVAAFAIDAIRQKRFALLAKATGVCIAGGLLGIAANMPNLYHTKQYEKESMRGGSEVVINQANDVRSASGLDRSYITAYSYGIGETWSLLVPNVKGGSSSIPLKGNETAAAVLKDRIIDFGGGQRMSCLDVIKTLDAQYGMGDQQSVIGQYWEESMMPGGNGTSGPVYVGAFVLTLFVLCLFVCRKNPLTWALLAATVLSILLSWGKNFMWFTDLFIDYVPMYAKFRTVESILVIAEFTIPLMAMMALKKVIEEPQILAGKGMRMLGAAFALTGGMALLFGLAPTLFFDFTTSGEQEAFAQMLGQQGGNTMIEALGDARVAVFRMDCWRSLLYIVLGTALILLYRAGKLKALPTVMLITAVCLVDLWLVNKRYLNDDMFVKASVRKTAHAMTKANEDILQDQTLDYRVLNLYSNTFNENETSYYHKSIGGYHAAKLGRYQDMIEKYIAQEQAQADYVIKNYTDSLQQVPGDSLWPVLNMLNAKYFIATPEKAVVNPYAQGNAWFVDEVEYVDSAQHELDRLAMINLRCEAVADRQFEPVLGQAAGKDSTAMVTLTAYEPNKLTYSVESSKGGIVVFSEIYYPGWTATVDGQEVPLGRANYVLRALRVEPGSHEVVLGFFPQSVKTTESIAYGALAVIGLVVVLLIVLSLLGLWRKKKA